LTIAMDSGFPSLDPFNRAFKADTGLTPTEFRRLALAKAPSIRSLADPCKTLGIVTASPPIM